VSFYLAYRGWKVANVPIVLGIELPETMTKLNPRKVAGLTTDPERLALIRRERLRNMGAQESSGSYADLRHIQQELRYSLYLCKKQRWPVVNVSGKAVEETAHEVINLVATHPPELEEKT
jgi:hypothetical protein